MQMLCALSVLNGVRVYGHNRNPNPNPNPDGNIKGQFYFRGVMLNTAGEVGEAGEAGDIFSRPSYDSPGVPGGGRRHATSLSR